MVRGTTGCGGSKRQPVLHIKSNYAACYGCAACLGRAGAPQERLDLVHMQGTWGGQAWERCAMLGPRVQGRGALVLAHATESEIDDRHAMSL